MLMTDSLHQLLVPGRKHVGGAFLLMPGKGTDHTVKLVIPSTHIPVVGDKLELRRACYAEHSD